MNLGFLTADEFTGFTIESHDIRHSKESLKKIGVTYELSQSQLLYSRTVYSVFDYLSDIGGLVSALQPLCHLLIITL